MAERENPFTAMKRYLATMNKRIDDITAKANSLEEEIRRVPEQEASERSKLSDKVESSKTEMTSKLEDISSKGEEHHNQLLQAVEQLKQQLSEMKLSSASKDDLDSLRTSLQGDIAPLKDQKLDRTEFQAFVDKNEASIKEVFEDLGGSQSFADFASSKASSQPEPLLQEAASPTESRETAQAEGAPTETRTTEYRREDKRKKKWL